MFSSKRSSQISGGCWSVYELSEDRRKLRNLIKLCMNDDYNKAKEEEEEKKSKSNNVSFKGPAKPAKEEEFLDQAGLAFRKGALKALNQDKVLFKKMEMSCYVEDLRR